MVASATTRATMVTDGSSTVPRYCRGGNVPSGEVGDGCVGASARPPGTTSSASPGDPSSASARKVHPPCDASFAIAVPFSFTSPSTASLGGQIHALGPSGAAKRTAMWFGPTRSSRCTEYA